MAQCRREMNDIERTELELPSMSDSQLFSFGEYLLVDFKLLKNSVR